MNGKNVQSLKFLLQNNNNNASTDAFTTFKETESKEIQ